jgi:hypothetical protein
MNTTKYTLITFASVWRRPEHMADAVSEFGVFRPQLFHGLKGVVTVVLAMH